VATTSGFFENDGRRYCHILDPRNGLPVTHWQSVSIVSANTVSAGALSTIAMLKADDALAWLEAQGASYLAVTPRWCRFFQGCAAV
jgi:thiamine biosynthesis lipoprotein